MFYINTIKATPDREGGGVGARRKKTATPEYDTNTCKYKNTNLPLMRATKHIILEGEEGAEGPGRETKYTKNRNSYKNKHITGRMTYKLNNM